MKTTLLLYCITICAIGTTLIINWNAVQNYNKNNDVDETKTNSFFSLYGQKPFPRRQQEQEQEQEQEQGQGQGQGQGQEQGQGQTQEKEKKKKRHTKVRTSDTTIHTNDNNNQISGLSCDKYKYDENDELLLSNDILSEMVYWHNIPKDISPTTTRSSFRQFSQYENIGPKIKYISFEPDEADWNNQRMAIETVIIIAIVTGRILVLPPVIKYNYSNIFHYFDSTSTFHNNNNNRNDHPLLRYITLEEFLKREAMTGNLYDQQQQQQQQDETTIMVPNGDNKQQKVKVPLFPPNNRTDWTGDTTKIWDSQLWKYMRKVSTKLMWSKDECFAVFPANPSSSPSDEDDDDDANEKRLQSYFDHILDDKLHDKVRIESFTANPTPVDASVPARMREMRAHRKRLCVYDKKLQNAKYIHAMGDNQSGARMISHFYALLFFEDWKQDLWVKRLIRDQFRYSDDLHCTAAKIVSTLRQISKDNGNVDGEYDSFHIRRGDMLHFSDHARIDAEQIYDNSFSVIKANSTVYIATDEHDRTFFDPLRKHYKLYFLDDFEYLTKDVPALKLCMIDQLVASKGRTFVGLHMSTFTGYINRIRGYHVQKDKTLSGYENGIIRSYSYGGRQYKYAMRQYRSISHPIWAREFPIGWRDIDHDVSEEDFIF